MLRQQRKKVTIHDIAALAGVSASTVSRVLNQPAIVAPEKHAAVRAAMEELGFQPSLLAQGLARGQSLAIGVLTPSIASVFYAEVHKGIELGLQGSAYHPMFTSGNWHADKELASLELIKQRADALVILGGVLSDGQLRKIATERPLVVVGRQISGIEENCMWIDNEQGAYMATQYLLRLGHRQIAHISGPLEQPDSQARQAGYVRALSEAGVSANPQLMVEGNFSEQSGLMAVETLLARTARCTAIFAANDQTAYGARLALYRRGIRVPEDISLIGFDDLPTSAYMTPPLTTMRQPTIEMGLEVAKGVLELLHGKQPRLNPVTPMLVARESVVLMRG